VARKGDRLGTLYVGSHAIQRSWYMVEKRNDTRNISVRGKRAHVKFLSRPYTRHPSTGQITQAEGVVPGLGRRVLAGEG